MFASADLKILQKDWSTKVKKYLFVNFSVWKYCVARQTQGCIADHHMIVVLGPGALVVGVLILQYVLLVKNIIWLRKLR